MLTDDDVVARLQSTFRASVADLAPDPELRSRVWQEHRRSMRRKTMLVPGGLALGGLALAVTYVTQTSYNGRPDVTLASSPPPKAAPGPTVMLFGYTFTLPSGFVVTPVKHVDLSQEDPPQPVGGETAFVSAHKGQQTFSLTIFRGPIAAAEATVQPPNPGSIQTGWISGFPSKTYTYAAGGPECVTKGPDRSLGNINATGPCGQETSETRVTTAPEELVWVTTQDVSLTYVKEILESGL